MLLSLLVAHTAGNSRLIRAHEALPEAVARALQTAPAVADAAALLQRARECLVTSRGYNFATALEAALKLKESSRVVAEALSSADLLHGPIAVVEREFPVIVVAPPGRALGHLWGVLRRLVRRRARRIVLSTAAGTAWVVETSTDSRARVIAVSTIPSDGVMATTAKMAPTAYPATTMAGERGAPTARRTAANVARLVSCTATPYRKSAGTRPRLRRRWMAICRRSATQAAARRRSTGRRCRRAMRTLIADARREAVPRARPSASPHSSAPPAAAVIRRTIPPAVTSRTSAP